MSGGEGSTFGQAPVPAVVARTDPFATRSNFRLMLKHLRATTIFETVTQQKPPYRRHFPFPCYYSQFEIHFSAFCKCLYSYDSHAGLRMTKRALWTIDRKGTKQTVIIPAPMTFEKIVELLTEDDNQTQLDPTTQLDPSLRFVIPRRSAPQNLTKK